ncbi:MAG: exosortase [Candidatus Obscuribacterales bacterium]|nr:exosortase [Steroidobacteraceae bacterium]
MAWPSQAWHALLRALLAPGNKNVAIVFLMVALPFVVLWPSTQSLIALWNDRDHVGLTHGYLIVAIVAWLIWERRAVIQGAVLQPNRRALFALFLISIGWLLVLRAGIQVGHQLLLPVACALSTCAVAGWFITRRILFALAYLYFAMPVWTLINAPLQWGSIFAVRSMLRLAGIPAYFSGTNFEIPAGVLAIEGGCSGLRLMVVGLALAVLYGELQRASRTQRVLIILLAAGLSAFANWLRIFIIVLAAHYSGMDHPLVADHIWFGWVVFAVTMGVFFWIANRWLSTTNAPVEHAPSNISSAVSNRSNRAVVPWVLAALGAISIGPAWAHLQTSSAKYSEPQMHPLTPTGWERLTAEVRDWHPTFVGADRELQVAYRFDQVIANLYVATYREQAQGKEMIGDGNSITGDLPSTTLSAQPLNVAGVPLHQTIVQTSDGGLWLYWHTYRVGDLWLERSLFVQLWYGIASLWRIPESHVLIVRMHCGADCKTASQNIVLVWDAATRMLATRK